METIMSYPELLAVASIVVLLAILAWVAWVVMRPHLRASRRFGFDSLGEYLRAAPVTDEEKRDAVDLALKGVVLCLLGLLFAPLILIGLVPLFFGARKVSYGSMGLGLVDDARPRDG